MTNQLLSDDKTALLLIDMQHDFARPDGAAYISGTQEAVPSIISLTNLFRKENRPIYHIIRLYHTDGSNAELCRKDLIISGKSIVAPNTPGAAILPELLPADSDTSSHSDLLDGKIIPIRENEFVLYKPRWGAFYNTGLHAHLSEKGINSLFIAGCNFPNCPRTTIYEASERDYKVSIVPAAISGVYEKGLGELRNIGVHIFDDPNAVSLLLSKGISLVDFRPEYKWAFHDLNKAWLNRYFQVEPIDEYVLSNPEEAILESGGKVFFALKDGKPVGTGALKRMDDDRIELTKMAVDDQFQGHGIGKALCQYAIDLSARLGYRELVLFSHSSLGSAIHIYRKLGFKDAELDTSKYKRADVMMTYPLVN